MKIRQIIEVMEKLAPPGFAEEWDRIGLQIGDAEADAQKVVVALTPSLDVLNQATACGAEIVISHHPLIFKPLTSLTGSTPAERLAAGFVKADVALFAAHTNLDNAPGGINDSLAECLGLTNIQPLAASRAPMKKVVVFVPEENLEQVAAAMCAAGAGRIGAYRDCTFRVKGTGTFTPMAHADPHIGRRGKLERVAEVRLESIVPAEDVAGVAAAIRESHPYEEPAFDIYPLENRRVEGGPGRWGMLERPVKASDFIAEVSEKLGARGIRYVGDAGRQVSKVAVCGGAGADLYQDALGHGCQAYVTGDVKYHTFLDAGDDGLILIDAGHAETELPGVRVLHERLSGAISDIEVVLSEDEGRSINLL